MSEPSNIGKQHQNEHDGALDENSNDFPKDLISDNKSKVISQQSPTYQEQEVNQEKHRVGYTLVGVAL
jgi:hypothetical protein